MQTQTPSRGKTAETWNPLADLEGHDLEEGPDADEDGRAFLIFMLGGQWLATDVAQVREILDDQPVTPLPKAPPDVEGMIDVRDSGVAIVDLTRYLGVQPMTSDQPRRIIVFEASRDSGPPLPIGVRTEAVRDVRQIRTAEIEDAPDALESWDNTAIEGVTRIDGGIVVVVDLQTVFGNRPTTASDMFDFR